MRSLQPHFAAFAALVFLSACATTQPHSDAGDELAHFQPLASDARVLVEPGAERRGERVAAGLPLAIAQVESAHYLPFRDPVRVYVCGTEACFHKLVPQRLNLTAAVLYENRLVLAPRLFDREPYRLQPILVHELSHLHLGQRTGHYSRGIPVWFHEGFACLVARGGGADLVSEEEALRAIRSGRSFHPEQDTDGVLRRTADDWGLSMSLFYRQAMRFVDYMRDLSTASFRHFVLALQRQENFSAAFVSAFGLEIADVARQYSATLHCADCAAPTAQAAAQDSGQAAAAR